jgi:hypothetical protein
MPWRQYVKSRIANATRQAHCQAHKTYSTEANLPMSLPACSAWVTVFRWTELNCKTLLMDRGKGERTTEVFAKAGRTEAVFQQFQHQWSVVRAGQATLSQLQIINFYFYFHHRLAGLDGSLFPSLRKYSVVQQKINTGCVGQS